MGIEAFTRGMFTYDERMHLAALLVRNQAKHIDAFSKLNVLSQFPKIDGWFPELHIPDTDCHCGQIHHNPDFTAHNTIIRERMEVIDILFPNGLTEADTLAFLDADAHLDAIMDEPHHHPAPYAI